MLRNFNKHRKYCLAIILAAVLIFLPSHPAKASWLANWTIEHTFGYVLFLVFSIAGKMIAGLAVLLNWAIHLPVYPDQGIAVIDKSWEIMRNFANMFFIVALILMAFATIFDVLPGAAKYNARALFGKFLFTALLINFSLVLGVMVINGTQVLSNTFLVAIGDMANRLGQDLNPSQLLPDESTVTAAVSTDAIVFGTLSTLIFSIVLVFTFLFSILTAFIFTFIRIPILWALLIVSPMAWILNVFPAGEGMFKKWWSTFIGWNMFLPIYLFFLYFGLYFLSNQKDIIQSIASEVSQAKITESLPFSLQLVFFYLMTAIFLIGGTIVAMKASMFSGTGVVQVAKWGRGKVLDRFGYTAASKAVKGRYEESVEKGQARIDRGTARFRDIIGGATFGRQGFQEEQLAKDVGTAKKRFERITDQKQLRELMNKGPVRDRLGATEILKDRKLLTAEERQAGYELYEENSPLGAKQFARSLDYDKMSADERMAWLGRVPDIETQQKIVTTMADKGDRYLTNTEEGAEQNLNKALDLFGLEGEQRDLLKKVEKHNFELSTEVGLQNQLLMKAGKAIENTPEGMKIAMEEAISRMNPDALLEATRALKDYVGVSTGPGDTEYEKRRDLVMGSLNQQKIEAMMAKGTKQQLESWQKISPDKFDAEKIKAEKERATEELEKKKAEYLADALKKAGVGGTGSGPAGGTPSPTTGRGTGNYPRGQVGFTPPTNPNNTVDLRNKNNP